MNALAPSLPSTQSTAFNPETTQSSIQATTMQIEAYLMQLSDVQQRWQKWLSEMQRATANRDLDKLNKLQQSADGLNQELRDLTANRQQMISEARQNGQPVRSLRGIAERLPAWGRPRFRAAFNTARNQIEQLQRMHIATWVLVNQSVHYFQEINMLFSYGAIRNDVYELPHSNPLEGGGQLLDASL